jgi:hypothetical protein
MNDGVIADMYAHLYDDRSLALGIQLKTTAGPAMGTKNTYRFVHVTGYWKMAVVCWMVDQNAGYLFDGTELHKRNIENLVITPGGENTALALSGPAPVGMDRVIECIEENIARFKSTTKEFLSWEFSGEKADQLKERVGLHQYMTNVDRLATFPQAQNGSHDLEAGDPTDLLPRKQFKTACEVSGQSGLQLNLQESAGRVNGKRTYRPYTVGAFDELIVYNIDWQANQVHMWRIPASKLAEKGFLRTDTQDGHQGLTVYKSKKRQSKHGPPPDTWTAAYYKGMEALCDLPQAAEEAAKKMLAELRSGKQSGSKT